ncbi:unnamed protein product [Pleuronectes platessa]|uniref:Uncharacterized protein n=1 Tax=Pleuronectes platessa TaxID=8262 RepID=A0A9N7Z4U8_PLEPL|nr:unnamed protein product [Pleuronectes platessa]
MRRCYSQWISSSLSSVSAAAAGQLDALEGQRSDQQLCRFGWTCSGMEAPGLSRNTPMLNTSVSQMCMSPGASATAAATDGSEVNLRINGSSVQWAMYASLRRK